MKRAAVALLFAAAAPAAATEVPASTVKAGICEKTLIGTPLRLPELPAATQRRIDQDIEIARAALRIAPDRPDSHFWLARRLSYAGRFCESIDVLTAGIAQFPQSYELRRYRGRKLARARQFAAALADYREGLRLMGDRPDHFEPDGLPNRLGLTIGTYRGNLIYYHAQTSFAVGDYRTMVEGMTQALELAPSFAKNDMLVPTAYWTYLAHRKLGEHDKARAAIEKVPAQLELIENHAYLEAVKVMQGRLPLAEAVRRTDPNIRFAVAMEHRFAGRETEATAILRQIVTENAQGHWPAEVELIRPGRRAATTP
jgi:tetratricopeptide (TPR) repeat protein